MSKVTTGSVKKKGRKKKLSKVSSPDLLDNILPHDLDLDGDLELSSLEYEHFKPPNADGRLENSNEPMFPHELHMALKNQIQGLEEEKEELKTKLRKAEERFTAASPLRNLGRSSDLAANRIVELGKKVKELQAQIRRQNSASKKTLNQETTVGGSGDASTVPVDDTDNSDSVSCCGQARAQLGEMTDRLNSANTKLCELRNMNQHLRHEHKLALKALSSELGEKVNVMNILSGGQGWRGRAQQVLSLQQKVTELTEKLTAAQAKSNISESCASREKNKAEVDSLKSEVDSLRAESENLRMEIADTKRKLDESRARVRSLQAELSALRQANSSMAEKMASDKKHIDSLSIQLGSLNEKTRGKEQTLNNKYEQQIASLRKDLSQEKLRNDQLQEVIKEKDSRISHLQLKTSVINQSYSLPESETEPRCVSASTRSASLDREITNNSSTSEAERVRLMELVGVNARRLQEERRNSTTLEEQLRAERHRCVRLETKLARIELERIGWAKGLYKKPPLAEPSFRSDNDWDSLKDKAELLEEKCLALESRVKTLQQEKEDDSRRFIQIIEEQRVTFHELQRKSNVS